MPFGAFDIGDGDLRIGETGDEEVGVHICSFVMGNGERVCTDYNEKPPIETITKYEGIRPFEKYDYTDIYREFDDYTNYGYMPEYYFHYWHYDILKYAEMNYIYPGFNYSIIKKKYTPYKCTVIGNNPGITVIEPILNSPDKCDYPNGYGMFFGQVLVIGRNPSAFLPVNNRWPGINMTLYGSLGNFYNSHINLLAKMSSEGCYEYINGISSYLRGNNQSGIYDYIDCPGLPFYQPLETDLGKEITYSFYDSSDCRHCLMKTPEYPEGIMRNGCGCKEPREKSGACLLGSLKKPKSIVDEIYWPITSQENADKIPTIDRSRMISMVKSSMAINLDTDAGVCRDDEDCKGIVVVQRIGTMEIVFMKEALVYVKKYQDYYNQWVPNLHYLKRYYDHLKQKIDNWHDQCTVKHRFLLEGNYPDGPKVFCNKLKDECNEYQEGSCWGLNKEKYKRIDDSKEEEIKEKCYNDSIDKNKNFERPRFSREPKNLGKNPWNYPEDLLPQKTWPEAKQSLHNKANRIDEILLDEWLEKKAGQYGTNCNSEGYSMFKYLNLGQHKKKVENNLYGAIAVKDKFKVILYEGCGFQGCKQEFIGPCIVNTKPLRQISGESYIDCNLKGKTDDYKHHEVDFLFTGSIKVLKHGTTPS